MFCPFREGKGSGNGKVFGVLNDKLAAVVDDVDVVVVFAARSTEFMAIWKGSRNANLYTVQPSSHSTWARKRGSIGKKRK